MLTSILPCGARKMQAAVAELLHCSEVFIFWREKIHEIYEKRNAPYGQGPTGED
jgi:hypothetical protein